MFSKGLEKKEIGGDPARSARAEALETNGIYGDQLAATKNMYEPCGVISK